MCPLIVFMKGLASQLVTGAAESLQCPSGTTASSGDIESLGT